MRPSKRSFLLFLLFGVLFSFGTEYKAFMPYKSGAPGGDTGSPGDGGSTCARAGCHSSFAPNPNGPDVQISSNIPATGYIPGSTYTVTASILKGGTTFGFEVTAEDSNDQKVGDPLITQGTETQLTNNGKAVTHTSNGNGGTGSRSWSFKWKAPSSGAGPVTFYGAFNQANGDGGPAGDSIQLTQYGVPMNNSWTSIKEWRAKEKKLSFQPQPVRSELWISGIPVSFEKGRIELRDPRGHLVRTLYQGKFSTKSQIRLSLPPGMPSGVYFLQVVGKRERISGKLLVQ